MASNGQKNATDAIGAWLAVLVAGIVGAFSFLGLEQDEIAVMLRRFSWQPSLVALLTALAIIGSILSIFAAGKRIRVLAGSAFIVAVIATVPLAIWAVPSPSSVPEVGNAMLALAALLLVIAVLLFLLELLPGASPKMYISLQAVMLIVSVCFAASSIYSAMRLVARSQHDTTSPQVDSTVTSNNDGAKIDLKVRAAKLRHVDDVSVTVLGVPRERSLGDDQRPCESDGCQFVSGAILAPDELGNVSGTIAVPIDVMAYQHISVRALVCIDRTGDRCAGGERLTTMDFRLPRPPEPTSTTKE